VGHFALFPLFGKEGLGEILLIITHSISIPKTESRLASSGFSNPPHPPFLKGGIPIYVYLFKKIIPTHIYEDPLFSLYGGLS
jgi:hypothetical protein